MFGEFLIAGYTLMALNIASIFPLRTNAADPQLSAKSVLIIDTKTGQTLYGKKAQDIFPLASLTKLLSSLVVLDAVPLEKDIELSQDIIDTGGGADDFKAGERVQARHLLFSALIHSSNDAMLGLAYDLGKENFLTLAKAKLLQLGIRRTKIADPAGLEAETTGSAADVAKFAQAAFGNDFIRKILAIPEYTFVSQSGISHNPTTTNPLIFDPRVIVAKTGTLEAVGQNYAALIRPPRAKDDLIMVLLGSSNREKDALALLGWLGKSYTWE